MPTIIDSLFLELGIDTTKFSKDQSKALAQISKFEFQAKKSAGAVSKVGDAFRDIGRGAQGSPFGALAKGLGMLLSPEAIGVAAIGLLGKGMWDLNKAMTTTNAIMVRQSQLSSMNADNLWAWGEAAKTVGASPGDITGGISGLQTSIAGMMIGAGDATPQLVALARLGLGWNPQDGLNDAQVTKMFTKVHDLAAAKGYKNLGGLRALTGPIMNDAMFALATSPNFNPATIQGQIKGMEPKNLGAILQDSLKSQEVLGRYGIAKDILAETTYGGEQGLMQAVVQILTSLLTVVTKIADFLIPSSDSWLSTKLGGAATWVGDQFTGGKSPVTSRSTRAGMSKAMAMLVASGLSQDEAAAAVGSLAWESSGMNPFARNGSHFGLAQWDSSRQAEFKKKFGYQMGSGDVSEQQQFNDQLKFLMQELSGSHREALIRMRKAQSLMGKESAFMRYFEVVNDASFGRRLAFANQALQLPGTRAGAGNTVSTEVNIGDVNMHGIPTADPAGFAKAFRQGLADQPLLDLNSQGFATLSTRGMTQ